MPTTLLVAARRGDPGAFARVVEHWDPHLRRFAHLVLAGTGSVDRVLGAAYVSAYRALPRYRADRTPGLWLHRVAYLAASDEVRRLTRDPLRKRARPDPVTPADDDTTAALRTLALDQRALAVLVDVEGYLPEAVADAFDTERAAAADRLAAARRVLDGTDLAAVAVPPATADFWPDLGRRLLRERELPAAPSIDPAARLARSHPAEPGFRPASTRPGPASSVATLADRADRQRPPRRWGRPLAITAGATAVLGLVAAAVAIGLSGHPPDGSVEGRQLATTVATAFTSSRYLQVDVNVVEAGIGGRQATATIRLTLADDGSWSSGRTDAIDVATFDAQAGVARRVAAIGGGDGAAGSVLAAGQEGLAAGPPDPSVELPAYLADLAAVGTLLRSAGERRAPVTGTGARRTWTYTRSVGTGPRGADESWEVEVRQSDGFPIRIERRRDGELVRRTRFRGWMSLSEVPPASFATVLVDGATTTGHGFLPTDLAAVELLGRGQAVTPAWLPAGFELGGVFIRVDPPVGAPGPLDPADPAPPAGPPGVADPAVPAVPADRAVMSLAYQRGVERITVTTRARGGPDASRGNPFPTVQAVAGGSEVTRILGDGYYNQIRVRVTTDALGRAQLWGLGGDTLFTVGGDLTAAEALRLASSLR